MLQNTYYIEYEKEPPHRKKKIYDLAKNEVVSQNLYSEVSATVVVCILL